MTLEEAFAITEPMTKAEHMTPTKLQRDAKEVVFNEHIMPLFCGSPPLWVYPDYVEGWTQYKGKKKC